MGRVVAGELLHQKSKDMRRVAKCPLDWAEAAIVGSLVDLRDHIVQGSHQATGILSQSGVGWWNNVTARRVTWCRLSRIARRVCVCVPVLGSLGVGCHVLCTTPSSGQSSMPDVRPLAKLASDQSVLSRLVTGDPSDQEA